MQIDVKPLVWVELSFGMWQTGDYQIEDNGPNWKGDRFAVRGTHINNPIVVGRYSTHELAKSAANAHHAAQVRSQVAGVRLSDDEARAVLRDAHCAAPNDWPAVQAAIAATQVDADPAPGNGDDDGE